MLEASRILVEYLRESGPKKVHNVDNLLLRESMDVIGAHFSGDLVCHMGEHFLPGCLRAANHWFQAVLLLHTPTLL